jgi:periplasmic protein TonB
MGGGANLRLVLALALSALVHLSLIFGIAAARSDARPARTILARLAAAPAPAPSGRASRGVPAAALAGAQAVGHTMERIVRPQHPADAAIELAEPVADLSPEPALPVHVENARLPEADLPLILDPTWYEAKELDTFPRPLARLEPAYPVAAVGASGEVTLLLKIDERGAVLDASIVRADPEGVFEASALEAVSTARFSPGQKEGQAVRSRIVVKVRFAPQVQASALP